jgi:segregation and condensation protein A
MGSTSNAGPSTRKSMPQGVATGGLSSNSRGNYYLRRGAVAAILVQVSSLPFNFHLEKYDGPLDLLLDLIRKQQIDIYDIPIAMITSQYLAYMEKAVQTDMDLGSEFVYMAATLIQIKSKLLLPKDPELEKISPSEDPRKELVERLLEHERFKSAAEMLQQKRVIEEAVWSNPQIQQFASEDDQPGLAVSLFDLVKTFQQVLDRAKNRPVYEIGKEDVSVPEMITYLGKLLKERRRGPLSATRLFEQQRSRRAMICLFLAILELVKRQAIQLTQGEAFGDIGLESGDGLEELGAEQVDAIEQEYN